MPSSQKNVAELKAAGAILVDPVVIPDMKTLMTTRGSDTAASDEALRLYLARNPSSPLKSRQDIADSPDMARSIPPSVASQWKSPRSAPDLAHTPKPFRRESS